MLWKCYVVLSIKKQHSSFLKRVCVFQSQSIEIVQNFQWLSHESMPISQMEGYFKNPYLLKPFFRWTYALSVGFKMKPLRKSIVQCEDKDQLSFCQKPCWNAERSNHLFISNWSIAFFKHLYSLILWQYTEINWLCKHTKMVRSSLVCLSINSCTELSKTKFSLWVLLSQSKCSLEPKIPS